MSIALASISAFAAALGIARNVDFTAYTLAPGLTRDALASAARGGAQVRVRLERDPLDDAAGSLHRANADVIRELSAAGADAALTPAGAPVAHMKAAIVDGAAWLDDRNWAEDGRETIVRDTDPDDVAALGAALRGEVGAAGNLRTTKAGAQMLELDVIRAAGAGPLVVESESFGSGAVYSALLARARTGAPTQLLVAGREAAKSGSRGATELQRLERLAALGVEVRTGDPAGRDFDEKLAVTLGAAWVGSANATYARGAAGEQRDWGLSTREVPLVDGLRTAFERNWSHAHPLGDGTLAGASCAKPSAITSAIRPPVLNGELRLSSAPISP